jgi:hypothetical protein
MAQSLRKQFNRFNMFGIVSQFQTTSYSCNRSCGISGRGKNKGGLPLPLRFKQIYKLNYLALIKTAKLDKFILYFDTAFRCNYGV